MLLTVTVAGSDAVVALEVSDEMSVGDFEQLVLSELGCNASEELTLSHHGRLLGTKSEALGKEGLRDHDLLRAAIHSTSKIKTVGALSESGPIENSPAGRDSSKSGAENESDQIEHARQQILGNRELLGQLSDQFPELSREIHEPSAFRRIYSEMYAPHLLHGTSTEEQRAIDENLALALEEMPEAFASVAMLYANVEVNSVPIKAFIDSGAQTTIMSPDCAERCQLSHLIDKRHRGMAYGVGQAKILGRIHIAPIKIGNSYFACAMTVIENTNMDLLLGLDMLKHHQAVIDLRRGRLIMGPEELPFLDESQIPQSAPPDFVNPPEGLNSNGSRGNDKPLSSNEASVRAGSVKTTAKTKSVSSNKTHGIYDVVKAARNGRIDSRQARSSLPLKSDSSSQSEQSRPQWSEAAVKNLIGLGFTREQVLRALNQANGNPDIAAAMLFDQ